LESLKYAIKCYWPYILVIGDSNKIWLQNIERRLTYEIKGEKTVQLLHQEINKFVLNGFVSINFLNLIFRIATGLDKKEDKVNFDDNIWAYYIHDMDIKYAALKYAYKSPQIYYEIIKIMAKKRINYLNMIQAINMPSSILTRTQYLLKNGSGIKKVALLGDDDMLSLLLRNYFEVSVFDLDKELIKCLENENIKCVHQNFLDPFDPLYSRYFDVVFCDPPTSPQWISLFLDRAISLTKIGGIISIACNPLGNHILQKEVQKRHLRKIYSEKVPTFYFDFRYDRMNYISIQNYYVVSELSKSIVEIDKNHPAKIFDKTTNSSTLYYYCVSENVIIGCESNIKIKKSWRNLLPLFW
jgi:hypothetical protein